MERQKRITEWDANELEESWNTLLDSYNKVKDLVRRNVSVDEFYRLKGYAFGNIEAGLGVGDALPSMYPLHPIVEAIIEDGHVDQDEDEDEQDR